MADLRKITWLASYPKSGNTWLRVFLANYVVNQETPVSINQVHRLGFSDSIAKDYFMAVGRAFDTRNLDAVAQVRPRVLMRFASTRNDVIPVKTHQRNMMARGVPLIPNEVTKAAIYIVRNPLDMVLSYARHFSLTPEQATEMICSKKNAVLADPETIGSYLGTWQEHVSSWAAHQPYPVEVVRYEDMLDAPQETFGKIIAFLGLPVDQDRLARAIAFSSFKELKKQEDAEGFTERSDRASGQFFAKGGSGHWRDELDPALVAKIRKVNRVSMQRFGYYNE